MNPEPEANPRFRLFPGLWIVLGIAIVLAARVALGWAQHPHNLEQLAKDFSSVEISQRPPVVNHAGNRIGMIHNTPQGVGIFIADLGNKTEQKICEDKDADYMSDSSRLFGWAPDDSVFAYSWDQALHFLNDKGGEIPSAVGTNTFRSFVWLTPERCLYINADAQMSLIQKIQDRWHETASWTLPSTNGNPRSPVALGTNTVCWQTDGALWKMELGSGGIERIYCSGPHCGIASVSWSPDVNSLLLAETTNRLTASWLVTLSKDGSVLARNALEGRLRDVRWINKGKGCAYRLEKTANTTLVIKATNDEPEKALFATGQVIEMFSDEDSPQVYALASRSEEAPGIWGINTQTGEASECFTPWGFRDVKLHFQPALAGYAPMGSRHNARFVLIPPANFSRQKKYPLIIGMQTYEWTVVGHSTYSQALANAGAYVALTGYHYSGQTTDQMLEHTNNVLAIYAQMMKNPNIDSSQVYLFAFSSSTIVINRLLEDYPGRFRGIMLFSPTAELPEAKHRMTSGMLVTAGQNEHWIWKKFPDYEKKLVEAGITMNSFVHTNSSHIERAQDTMRERALLMGKMVFSD